jgi:hypothetical protein
MIRIPRPFPFPHNVCAEVDTSFSLAFRSSYTASLCRISESIAPFASLPMLSYYEVPTEWARA